MGHAIEQMADGSYAVALGGGKPGWHQLGQVFRADTTHAEDMMDQSHTGWEVETFPLYADPHDSDDPDAPLINIPDRGIRRVTDGAYYGTCSALFTPFQNRSACDLLAAVVGDDVALHTGGSLDGGRTVFYSAKVRQDLLIAGETYETFMVLVNGHDATRGMSIYPTNMRPVCKNTVSWSERHARAIFWAKHTPSITELQKTGVGIIRDMLGYSQKFKATGEKLCAVKLSGPQVDAFWRKLVPFVAVDESAAPEVVEAARKRRLQTNELRDLLSSTLKTSADLENIRGTGWGIVQAIAEVETHKVKPRQSDAARFERIVAGKNGLGLASRALPMLLAR